MAVPPPFPVGVLSDAQPYHHGNLRHALVQAGVELARTGGPDALVLREAARRVGVSATAAYRHFDALPALVDAVAEEGLAALARRMEAELARCKEGDTATTARDRMRAIGRGYVRFALAEPGLFAVSCTRPSVEKDVEAPTDVGLSPDGLLFRSLDDLVAAGDLAPEDRDAAATLAWATVHGLSLLLLGPLSDVPADRQDAMIEDTLELVGRGFLRREPSSSVD